jgi:tRNA threonylcarbamoyladenosine biosynthesis protein TsaE
MKYITNSVGETEALGARLARSLRPGNVVAFFGDLGAGKTAFVRGMAEGLGVREPVTSPTYTIVNEYLSGSKPLFHFDLYRLSGPDDLFDIGWEDYLERGGLCAVEWSERVEEVLEDAVRVTIRMVPDSPDSREITVDGGSHAAISL